MALLRENRATSLESLPVELVHLVANYLLLRDIASLSMVSSRLRGSAPTRVLQGNSQSILQSLANPSGVSPITAVRVDESDQAHIPALCDALSQWSSLRTLCLGECQAPATTHNATYIGQTLGHQLRDLILGIDVAEFNSLRVSSSSFTLARTQPITQMFPFRRLQHLSVRLRSKLKQVSFDLPSDLNRLRRLETIELDYRNIAQPETYWRRGFVFATEAQRCKKFNKLREFVLRMPDNPTLQKRFRENSTGLVNFLVRHAHALHRIVLPPWETLNLPLNEQRHLSTAISCASWLRVLRTSYDLALRLAPSDGKAVLGSLRFLWLDKVSSRCAQWPRAPFVTKLYIHSTSAETPNLTLLASAFPNMEILSLQLSGEVTPLYMYIPPRSDALIGKALLEQTRRAICRTSGRRYV